VSDVARWVIDMLARAVGEEPARRAVEEVLTQLGRSPEALDRRGALEVLETLAQRPGLVGTSALFAKSRIYLA